MVTLFPVETEHSQKQEIINQMRVPNIHLVSCSPIQAPPRHRHAFYIHHLLTERNPASIDAMASLMGSAPVGESPSSVLAGQLGITHRQHRHDDSCKNGTHCIGKSIMKVRGRRGWMAYDSFLVAGTFALGLVITSNPNVDAVFPSLAGSGTAKAFGAAARTARRETIAV